MLRFAFLVLATVAVSQAQSPPSTHRWRPGAWTTCTATCAGRGMQQRTVDCIDVESGRAASAELCRTWKPSSSQACGFVDCEVTVTSQPGPCSQSCGSGVRLPITSCRRVLANGTDVALTQAECDKHDSGAFSSLQRCNPTPCPPEYKRSEWGACSKTCGTGSQRRSIECYQMRGGVKRKVRLHACKRHLGRERAVRTCTNEHLCPDNYYWRAEKWSPCLVTCQQHRKVGCFSNKDNEFIDQRHCTNFKRPVEVQRCINSGIYAWRVAPWGSCSKTCGGGSRMRQVYCVNALNNHPARSCPLCLKPKDSIECANTACPESLGSHARCEVEHEPFHCRYLKTYNLCVLDHDFVCCDKCPRDNRDADINSDGNLRNVY